MAYMVDEDEASSPGSAWHNPFMIDDDDEEEDEEDDHDNDGSKESVDLCQRVIQADMREFEMRRASKAAMGGPVPPGGLKKNEASQAAEEAKEARLEDEVARELDGIVDENQGDGAAGRGPNEVEAAGPSNGGTPGRSDPLRRWSEQSNDFMQLPEFVTDRMMLRPGMFVELEPGLVLDRGVVVPFDRTRKPVPPIWPIQFLHIQGIVRPTPSSMVVLAGWVYARARMLRGLIPRKLNEVCRIGHVDADVEADAWAEHSLVEVRPEWAICERDLRVTNAPFPQFRFAVQEYEVLGKRWVQDRGLLVCRWRYTEAFQGLATRRVRKKPLEAVLEHVGEDGADVEFRIREEVIINSWRGGSIPGGSHNGRHDGAGCTDNGQLVIDVDEHAAAAIRKGKQPEGQQQQRQQQQQRRRRQQRAPLQLAAGQKYTAGDVFSGRAGAARGIKRAGLELKFVVDNWEQAIKSLRLNFGGKGTWVVHADVTDFVCDAASRFLLDVMHLSPPCQVWSPAHTVAGQNDEANTAALFACTALIERARPRLFTLEQTFGMLHACFEPFFNSLVQGFTRFGYSVRWRVVHLVEYGLPQTRRRLIMIGAGPGEALPTYPAPTHSLRPRPGLLPATSVRSALARLGGGPGAARHEHHRPEAAPAYDPAKPAWNPDEPLHRTITCCGGQTYHWTGRRDFTGAELAMLQGFPRYHRFEKGFIKKQIGNAFPSCVVEVFYRHLVAHLERHDNVDGKSRLARRLSGVSVIEIDGDETDGHNGGDELIYMGSRCIGKGGKPQ